MDLKKIFFKRVNIIYFALIIVFICNYSLSFVFKQTGQFWTDTFGINMIFILVYSSISILIAWVMLGMNLKDLVNFRKFNITNAVLLIFMGLGLSIAAQYVTELISVILNSVGFTVSDYNAETIMPSGTLQISAYMFLNCVMPAVFEEILHRGVILNALKPLNKTAAIIISAFGFSMFHMTNQQIPYTFILGIMLAWMAIKLNSIIPCMILHCLANLYATIIELMYTKPDGTQLTSNDNTLFADSVTSSMMTGLVLLGVCSLIIYIIINKKTDNGLKIQSADPLPTITAYSAYMSSPVFWLHFVLCTASAFFVNFVQLII